jgi:hypothetical protein
MEEKRRDGGAGSTSAVTASGSTHASIGINSSSTATAFSMRDYIQAVPEQFHPMN